MTTSTNGSSCNENKDIATYQGDLESVHCGILSKQLIFNGKILKWNVELGNCKQNLEDLMMEGDLIEVSVDETAQIWQLLQTVSTLLDNDESVRSIFIIIDYTFLIIKNK